MRSGRKASRAGLDRIDPHRPGDVFEFLVAKINELFLQTITHLVVGVLGKTDTARLGNAFKPRRDIDAVAE